MDWDDKGKKVDRGDNGGNAETASSETPDLKMKPMSMAVAIADSRPETPPPLPDDEILPNEPAPIEIVAATEERVSKHRNADGGDESGDEEAAYGVKGGWDLSAPWRTAIAVFEVLVVCSLMLLPTFCLGFLKTFDTYDLLVVKSGEGLNAFMEFQRWSVFFASAYGAYVVLDWLVGVLPAVVGRIYRFVLHKPLPKNAKRKLVGLRYAQDSIVRALFALVVIVLAGSLIYTSMIDTSVILIKATAAQKEELARQQRYHRFEKLLIIGLIFSLFLALEKYIMEVITVSFHKLALAERIRESNERFQTIATLYRSTSFRERKFIGMTLPSSTTATLAHGAGQDVGELALVLDKASDLTSKGRARKIAKTIYRALCPADRDYLIPADFRPYFATNAYEAAFAVFDRNRSGTLDREAFGAAVVQVYEERDNVAQAMITNGKILRKIDYFFLVMFLFTAFLISLCYYFHEGYVYLASLGSILLSISFLFKDSGQRVFNSMIFIFAEHPFDTGDAVIIDGEKLTVQRIDIFTSLFVRQDGTLCYIPNIVLSGKTIFNVRRADLQVDSFTILLDAGTAMSALGDIKSKLTDKLKMMFDQFTSSVNVNVVGFTEGAPRRARVKVETKFVGDMEKLPEPQLLARRRQLAEALTQLSDDLELNALFEA